MQTLILFFENTQIIWDNDIRKQQSLLIPVSALSWSYT